MKINFTPLNFSSNQNKKRQYKSEYTFPPVLERSPEADEYIKPICDIAKEKKPALWDNIKNFANNIPKSQTGIEALASYITEESTYDEFLEDCSRGNLEFICNPISAQRNTNGQIDIIEEIFKKGGVEASNYEMMLHLIEEGMLHPATVLFSTEDIQKTVLNPQFTDDLDKIYQAKIENKSLEEVFVPEFKNKKEAAKSLNTGDVCVLSDNENISIKLKDGSIKELFITPQTYLELFPPAQKFSLTQGAVNDCFLVSTVNSIFLNPSTRNNILEMFKENADGTVDVCLKGYQKKGKEILPKIDSIEIKDAQKFLNTIEPQNKTEKCARHAEFLRLIENAYRYEQEEVAYEQLQAFRYVFNETVDKLENDDDCVEISEMGFTKKEMELFLELTKDIDSKEKMAETMVSIDHIGYYPTVISPKIVQFLKQDIEQGSLEDKYTYQALARHINFLINNKMDNGFLTGLFPLKFYQDNIHKIKTHNSNVDYIDFGTIAKSFKKLGFNDIAILKPKEDGKKVIDILNKDNLNDKYLITLSSAEADNKFNFVQSHAYCARQIETDGEKKFAIANPFNASKEIIASAQEMAESFEDLILTKIN